jgi:hypothetical protein
MIFSEKAQRILWYQHMGFACIIALSWLNELLGLPRLIFGGDILGNWRESLLETVLVVLVWAGVVTGTRRLLNRLHYLEDFLRVCAWCRKISHGGEWMPIEEFFAKGFGTTTSHSICPSCAEQLTRNAHPPASPKDPGVA